MGQAATLRWEPRAAVLREGFAMALTASYTFHGLTIELHEDKTTTPAAHPTIAMSITSGLPILGGGAVVDYGSGPGSLLTAMFPTSGTNWEARAKDHGLSSPATIGVACFAASIPPSGVRHRRRHHVDAGQPPRCHGDVASGLRTGRRGCQGELGANRGFRQPAHGQRSRQSVGLACRPLPVDGSREGPPASRSVHHLRLGAGAGLLRARLNSGRRKPRRRGLAQNQAIGSISAHWIPDHVEGESG